MPRKSRRKPPDPDTEVLETIADELYEGLKYELGYGDILEEEFQLWKHDKTTVYIGINQYKHIYARAYDGRCEVWSDYNNTKTDKYNDNLHPKDPDIVELTNPDFVKLVVDCVMGRIAEHCKDIFLEYLKILDNLRKNAKEYREKVRNSLTSPARRFSGDVVEKCVRAKQYQELVFEQMVDFSRHSAMIIDRYQNPRVSDPKA